MSLRAISRVAVGLLPFYLFGLAAVWALKDFYSRAGADDLDWVLAPTCWLAGRVSGIQFEPELRSGWVSHAHRMIVGPSCAGLNFLIIVFSTCYFTLLHRLARPIARGVWLAACLGAAYALTIVTNALRIVVAVHLYRMDIYGQVVTPQRIHQAAGAVIYCVSLVLSYLAVERASNRLHARESWQRPIGALAPIGWYLSITLVVPIMNRAYRQDAAGFLEHGVMVVAVCLLALVLFRLAPGWIRRPASRTRC